MTDPLVALMRRYVVDYLNRHDPAVAAEIMEPDYLLHIGEHVLSGRDDVYVPGVMTQLQQFPGLGLTVHEILCSGDRIALRFTEHGASTRHGGAVAAWAGVALYRWNGRRLTLTFAQEDYYSRRRQLATGACDPIEPPTPAPWDEQPQAANGDAERRVREWIGKGGIALTDGVCCDDGWITRDQFGLLEVAETTVDDLFSAGDGVAFNAVQSGPYLGGLAGLDEQIGRQASLHLTGIVRVDGDSFTGRVVRDRLGLERSLSRQHER